MHTKQWQSVCGFVTDVCESVADAGGTMRGLFDLITEDKGRVLYSWTGNGRQAYIRRGDFRRSVISVARKLTDLLPESGGMVGLHLRNSPFWPVCFWAILMSGHTPLILDGRRELFDYRTLKECSGIYCVTEDKNYPYVISPDLLVNSRSEVDSAFFDSLWADRVAFVSESADGALRAVAHSGKSVGGQLLRLRRVYRYNQSMFFPVQDGPMKVALSLPLSGFFGFLCGIVLYPCFGAELHLFGPEEDVQRCLSACRSLSVTHHCLSADSCGRLLPEIVRTVERKFPGDAARYLSWLRGEERINDFRVLSRFMSLSEKLRKNCFGKRVRCMLCTDDGLDPAASCFFSRLGIFFGQGCCVPELGLVSMELAPDPELRTGNSAGILLDGVTGMLPEDGKLVLDCGESVGAYLTPDGEEKLPSPFPLERQASFDGHSRLCFARGDRPAERPKAQADPELVLKMRELYAAVLNKPVGVIGEDMDFFSVLGGDSLSYFLLLQHIEVMFGIRIRAEERVYFSTARYAAETLKPYTQKKGVVNQNA